MAEKRETDFFGSYEKSNLHNTDDSKLIKIELLTAKKLAKAELSKSMRHRRSTAGPAQIKQMLELV